jgi:hypothetical protein
MKHTIYNIKYRKDLETLSFVINDIYRCEVYRMGYEDNYCLRIYLKNEELYSNWFDSDLGWVTGNEEYYTQNEIQNIVNEAYKIIDQYIGSSIIRG